MLYIFFFFFSSRRRHTRCSRDWSSDVCSSDLMLFVCGGVDIAEAYDDATLAYLRRSARESVKLGGLCTGSYVLARAGLLDGYRCAIHWENIAAVRDEFPNVDFSSDLFVIDRD